MTTPAQVDFNEADPPVALYRLFGEGGRLLYIGVTSQLAERMAQHARNKPWWPAVSRKTVAWFPGRADALRAEVEAIRAERPEHNARGALLAEAQPPDHKAPLASRQGPVVLDLRAERFLAAKAAPSKCAELETALNCLFADALSRGPADAYETLSWFQERLLEWRGLVAEQRAVAVRRMYEEHDLSLAELGAVIDTSRARAHQFLRPAPNDSGAGKLAG